MNVGDSPSWLDRFPLDAREKMLEEIRLQQNSRWRRLRFALKTINEWWWLEVLFSRNKSVFSLLTPLFSIDLREGTFVINCVPTREAIRIETTGDGPMLFRYRWKLIGP